MVHELELKAARTVAERDSESNRRLAERLARGERIARIGSWEWNRANGSLFCSDGVYRVLGVDPETFNCRSETILAMIDRDDRRAFQRLMLRIARGAKPEGMEVRLRDASDGVRRLRVFAATMRDTNGRPAGLAGTVQAASELARSLQAAEKPAPVDTLTELPNRMHFRDTLVRTLEQAKQAGASFAILFLDIDHFKRINDTLGQAVGDELLRIIAHRLARGMRLGDAGEASPTGQRLCRQGGDEFMVILDGAASALDAARAANRLLTILGRPISLGAQELFVSASIGIALYPHDGQHIDALLENASVAMYHAKANGRNRFSFYDDSMRAASAQRLSLERDLRKALEEEQFELYYQPQFEVPGCRIVGVEALIRWHHPTLGLLTPAHFIPIAEEAGLIMAIWEWVLVTALIQHNAWVEQGLPPVTVGVNLSSAQFSDPALALRVQEIAQVVDVPLAHLELEVTESMLLSDFDAALKTLTELRAMGVKIAIDDFGTGYSSLSYLRRLPLDKLKLDQSFIRDAERNPGDVAITRAVITMAQSLELAVVAEGVETQAQLDLLLSLGCTMVQGFLLGRPLPAAETAALLRQKGAAAPALREADASWGTIVQPRSPPSSLANIDERVSDGPP
jgi:diguanylate cyclase (GGDEF)-like protein